MQNKISKKMIFALTIFAVTITSLGFTVNLIAKDEQVASPYEITVVLDAGHGGIDGGSIGDTTGITECELNLLYVNKIENLLKSVGIKVIKTRTSSEGLYDKNAENFKKDDMQKRKQIIEQSNAQAVVSIHMNKFSLKSENGAQVFFNTENEFSQSFANCVRDELTSQIDNARKLTLNGDYYILKCTNVPSVLVECGFLSNPQEELLLQQEDYQDKLCYAIFCGIMKFLNN